jgi:hypothetical protein
VAAEPVDRLPEQRLVQEVEVVEHRLAERDPAPDDEQRQHERRDEPRPRVAP